MAKTLKQNSLMTLVANILVAASNWLILVIIAKKFDGQSLGQFVLALSICSPAFLFASFKVRTLIIVDTDWIFKLSEYATARLMANLVVTLFIVATVLYLPNDRFIYVLVLVLLYKWCDAWSEFCQSYLRRIHKFEYSSGSLVLRSILTILSVSLIAFYSQSFLLILIVWFAVTAIFASIDSIIFAKMVRFTNPSQIDFRSVFSMSSVHRAFTLYKTYATVAVAMAVSSLFVYIPNYFLNYQIGVEAAGVFAALSYFLVAGGIIINSLSQAVTPKLTQLFAQRELREFKTLTNKLCIVGIVLGASGFLVSYFFGAFFLQLFYNNSIALHNTALNWIMAGAGVRYVYIFIGTSFSSLKLFHIQTQIYGLGLLSMFLGCWFLIPIYQLKGAAIALFISTVIEIIFFVSVSNRQFYLAFNRDASKLT